MSDLSPLSVMQSSFAQHNGTESYSASYICLRFEEKHFEQQFPMHTGHFMKQLL